MSQFSNIMRHICSTKHLFLLCLLQGDPGGVIGIDIQKGERGFPGNPGLPVRCVFVCVCVFLKMYTCLKFCALTEKVTN